MRKGRKSLFLGIVNFFLLLMITSGSFAEEGWLSAQDDKAGGAPQVSFEIDGSVALTLDVNVYGVQWKDVNTKGGSFVRLDLPGQGITTGIGDPKLPVIRKWIEIPEGASVSAEVVSIQEKEILLADKGIKHRIVPAQAPVPKVPGALENAPFVLDSSRYETDAFLPAGIVELGEPALIRGHRVLQVTVYPFQYNPVQGKLKVLSRIRLSVRFSGGDVSKTLQAVRAHPSASFDGILGQTILNYGQFDTGASTKESSVEGILFIVADAYETTLNALVDWKRKKGFKVEVANTSTAGSTASEIKDYIQSAYDSWSDPSLTYIVLVGDTDTIPSFSGTTGSHVSDLYYATLSGSDYLPDAWIGRISVANATEAQTVADKILNYELGNFSGTAWIKNATFIATCDTGFYDVAEGTHDYVISNHMDPNGYTSDKLYCITYGAGTADVRDAVNAGRSMVTYSGHGSTTSWGGPSFSKINVGALTNGEMTPFVTSHACLTGSIQIAECFGEKWLRTAAIGFWGASNSTYWDEDDYLERGMYDAVYGKQLYALGQMVLDGLNYVYTVYGGAGETEYYFEIYHLLADPTLEPWTAEPGNLTVVHDSSTVIGAMSFTVTVMDGGVPLEGALVSLYKPSDSVHEAGLTGPSGDITLTLDPALASVGTMDVTVTKHDFLPYEGSCSVVPPDGPYLIYSGHAFDDSSGNGDGYANPGEAVLMPVTLENIGTETCTNGTGTIQTTSEWVETVSDNSADWPDIPSSSAATSSAPHFAWSTYAGTPDRTQIPFTLDWSCDGSSGSTIFFAEICADADGDGHTTCAGDCDDSNDEIYPGAAEVCDGADNNCDGQVDEGFDDIDGDGAASCVDCDDNDPTRYPGAEELCDGIDNDCDSIVPSDEADGDADGYRICENDCDDNDPAINPGEAENCSDGVDNDCDGLTDNADSECGTGWAAAQTAEASIQGSVSKQGSGVLNFVFLLVLPVGLVVALTRIRRRKQ